MASSIHEKYRQPTLPNVYPLIYLNDGLSPMVWSILWLIMNHMLWQFSACHSSSTSNLFLRFHYTIITLGATLMLACSSQYSTMLQSVDSWSMDKYRQAYLSGLPSPVYIHSSIILGIGSANERRHYKVKSSLIGWAHTQNDFCTLIWWICLITRYILYNPSAYSIQAIHRSCSMLQKFSFAHLLKFCIIKKFI